jgi:hypothetical protein
MLNCMQGIFCIYWDDQMTFVLNSVYMLHCIYWFVYAEPSLHPWDETNLIGVRDLLIVLLDSILKYFIKIFCIYFYQGN